MTALDDFSDLCRASVTSARETGAIDPALADRLAWMLDTVADNAGTWPGDKSGRWIGFVAGTLKAHGVPDVPPVPGRLCDKECPAAVSDAHLRILSDALDRIGISLPERSVITSRMLTTDRTVAGAVLGHVQGRMIAMGISDVETERNATRPIFHAAYVACGETVPDRCGPQEGGEP